MKIDLVSDVHLECGPLDLPGGDLLILAGDICEAQNLLDAFHGTRLLGPPVDKYLRFFETQCAKYQQVLYVMGNHEHYCGEYDSTAMILRRCIPDNITILNRDTVTIDNKVFVGATLWTDCNKSDWHTIYHLKKCMNDFRTVRKGGQRFLPEDSVELHRKDVEYIKLIAKQNANREVFVITHHTPSWASCHPKYGNDKLMNGGFHTELSDLILDHPNIKHWVHGHTHDPFDYKIGECRVVCNPRGYYPYEGSKRYKPVVLQE